MKRFLIAGMTAIALTALLLGGCNLGSTTGTGGSGTRPATTQSSLPSVGVAPMLGFMPSAGATFDTGLIGVGAAIPDAGGSGLPAVVVPLGGTQWRTVKLGVFPGVAVGAAEMGHTQVVVGMSSPPSGPQVPFVATSADGGDFAVQQLAQMFGGRSARMIGVVLTGELTDPSSVLVAAGIMQRTNTAQLGTVAGTDSFAMVSSDQGKTWTQFQTLPLPKGVVGAEAIAVARSPHSTPYPGVLVAGRGWTTDKKANPNGREVLILWGSLDSGKNWRVVHDPSFADAKLDLVPDCVAADNSNVVIVGTSVATGKTGARQQTVSWTADSSGTWSRGGDSTTLPATKSSAPTALLALADGGFLIARQVYDTGSAPFADGKLGTGKPKAEVAQYPDGGNGHDVSAQIPNFSTGAVVTGIAEFGSRLAFFGLDQAGNAQVWVADGTNVR